MSRWGDLPTTRNGRHRRWLVTVIASIAIVASGCSDGEPAELALAAPPEADATQLDLLVRETTCASGRPAHGRTDVDVDITPGEVRLRATVEPLDDPQDCQGNPWTPVTVDLGQEVAGRRMVDASVDPPEELGVVDPDPRSGGRTLEESIELALDWTPPDTYTLEAEAHPGTRYRVKVVGGMVIERELTDGGESSPLEVEPAVAPSLGELQDRIRTEPETVEGLVVEDGGELLAVEFDPSPNAVDDEIAFSVEWLTVGP